MKSRIRELEKFGFAAIVMLAAALFTACSSDDDIIDEPQQPDGVKTYTLTVEATKGDDAAGSRSTRALSLDGKTLNATWAQGEAVTVYNVTRSADLTGSLTAQSSGATTVLKGTLTGSIQNGDELKLKFLSPDYDTQDGTLAYIAAHCDYAEATVTVTDASTPSVTTTDASFVNQQAIVKFTLKDDPNSVFDATQLTVSDGTNTYTVTPSSATSEFFVALPGFTSQTVTLSATDGTNNVEYIKDGVSFDSGQYYEIGVKMTYLISTLEQWNSFAAKVNDGNAAIRAKQTANISGVTTVVGNSESRPFNGQYNGQGYTISNVNISGGSNPTGLFGTVNSTSAVIENVVVASGTVSSTGRNVGSVVGELNSGTVRYCANYAEVTSSYNGQARLGGVVGWMRSANSGNGGDNNLVSYCMNRGYIHAKAYVGGVVGSFGGGFITYCQNYGLIEATGDHAAGGIAGWQSLKEFKLTNSHNGGNVKVSTGCGNTDYSNKSHYLIGTNHLGNPSINYPTNTYLYTLTVTIDSTPYTESNLSQFEPSGGATSENSNPAGITIGGTTYCWNTPAP